MIGVTNMQEQEPAARGPHPIRVDLTVVVTDAAAAEEEPLTASGIPRNLLGRLEDGMESHMAAAGAGLSTIITGNGALIITHPRRQIRMGLLLRLDLTTRLSEVIFLNPHPDRLGEGIEDMIDLWTISFEGLPTTLRPGRLEGVGQMEEIGADTETGDELLLHS